MTGNEDRALARKALAERAGVAYAAGHTYVEVADELGVSYGKAYALVKEAGVATRPRGARPDASGGSRSVAPADEGTGLG